MSVPHGMRWVLTQGESRKTKRVCQFTEFILESLRPRDGICGQRMGEERCAEHDERAASGAAQTTRLSAITDSIELLVYAIPLTNWGAVLSVLERRKHA